MNENDRKRVVVIVLSASVFICIVILWALFALPMEFSGQRKSFFKELQDRHGNAFVQPLQRMQGEVRRILSQTSTREIMDTIIESATTTPQITTTSTVSLTATSTDKQ